MNICRAGRSAAAMILACVMLFTSPVQSLADGMTGAVEHTADANAVETEMLSFALIKPNDSGERVKDIQRRLAELGYFDHAVTGNFGSVTKAAVIAFQQACGLDDDGIVGQETYDRMFADDAPVADGVYVPAATPVPTMAPTNAPSSGVVPGGSSSSMPDFTGVLAVGSRGNEVKAAQQRLVALKYLSGGADGIYGEGTASAVRSFQIKCGITVDGTINFETYIRLYDENAPTGNVTATVTAAPTAAPTPETGYTGVLRKGSRGEAVRLVQARLIELDYLTGSADGIFGGGTRSAVIAFQQDAGLSQTGEVDEVTYNALFDENAGSMGGDSDAEYDEPTVDEDVDDTFETLCKGMSGDEVARMQVRLKELGYYNGSLKGNFGELTEMALKDFQYMAGLECNGMLDRATSTALYAADAPYKDYDESDHTELKQGDRGDDVKRMQQRLIELRYLTGTADGIYGIGTAGAVSAFQSNNGLDVTGVASVDTLQRLYADGALSAGESATPVPTMAPTAAPTATPVATRYPELRSGSVGSSVKELQQRLIELNYLNDRADGAYGNKTTAAVKAFQIKCGMTANGVACNATQIMLFSANAPARDADVQATPQPTVEAPTAAPTASVSYPTLRNGSTGEAVSRLQQALKELGYYTGSISAVYDDETMQAVEVFQRANSLSVDGVAGSATQTCLYSGDALSKSEAGDAAEGESNCPTQVSGTVKKPTIGTVVEMDWFENVDGFFNRSSGTFKTGSTAVITDVRTGITYTVRRLGGSNHADVEPLTAFDAWQMYRIYNKNWSWNRRPVIVTVGGKNIAASINGMPHGGEELYNNSFVGHSCIHFTNSRTHGTNRVDPDHQNAIQEALATSVSTINSRIQNQ